MSRSRPDSEVLSVQLPPRLLTRFLREHEARSKLDPRPAVHTKQAMLAQAVDHWLQRPAEPPRFELPARYVSLRLPTEQAAALRRQMNESHRAGRRLRMGDVMTCALQQWLDGLAARPTRGDGIACRFAELGRRDRVQAWLAPDRTAIGMDDGEANASAAVVLVHEPAKVQAKVRGLAARLHRHLVKRCGGSGITLVPILTGGLRFLADLLPRLQDLDAAIEPVRTKAVGDTGVQWEPPQDPHLAFQGRNVVIIDDIADSGCTLDKVRDFIQQHGDPRSVISVVLSRKPKAREREVPIEFVGFELMTDDWYVGYGMDVDERGRLLPYIGKLADSGGRGRGRTIRMPSTAQRARL